MKAFQIKVIKTKGQLINLDIEEIVNTLFMGSKNNALIIYRCGNQISQSYVGFHVCHSNKDNLYEIKNAVTMFISPLVFKTGFTGYINLTQK